MKIELSEILDQIKFIYQKLTEKYQSNLSEKEAVFAQTIKLQEEVGELSEQVLKMFDLQNSRKGKFIKKEIEGEILDVLNVTLILALHLEIDVEKIWPEKLNSILNSPKV